MSDEPRAAMRSIAELLDDFTEPKGTEKELDALLTEGVDEIMGKTSLPKSLPVDEEEIEREKLRKLTTMEKHAKAWDLRLRGVPVSAVASAFEVDCRTIHRWISEHVKAFRESLEQESAANLIAESFLYLGNIEDMCMFEINQMSGDEGVTVDGRSGAVTKNTNVSIKGMKVKFLQAALKARQMKIELGMATGVLPREPEKIYHSMSDSMPAAAIAKDDASLERSPDELKRNIIALMTRARRLG